MGSSSHNHHQDSFEQFAIGNQLIADPGSNGTFDLKGRDRAYAVIASGTRKLPDNTPKGVEFTVYATGTVTLTSVAGNACAVLATGEYAVCKPLTATTWGATVGTGAAVEINTAADVSVSDASSYTTATNVETALEDVFEQFALKGSASISTVGAGTLTAAGIVGGVILRTGSTAAYTDTTATGAEIDAVFSYGGITGSSWILKIRNAVAFPETIAAGASGVTLAGNLIVPPNSVGEFLVERTAAETYTITGLGSYPQCNLPVAQFNTTAAASPVTPAAGILTGANHVYYAVTTAGAFGITTRTAAELFGDIPNCHIGFKFLLTIISDGNDTVTITPGSNVTIPGDPDTAATNTTKTFLCTFTSATALTMQVVDMGVIDATA